MQILLEAEYVGEPAQEAGVKRKETGDGTKPNNKKP